MTEMLVWLYLFNAVLIITHEIDSAYWKEWELFGLPGGSTLFLALHLPLVFVILYGLLALYRQSMAGYILSLMLSGAGLFAYGIHTYFIKRGRKEFATVISRLLLGATLAVSLVQMVLTVMVLRK